MVVNVTAETTKKQELAALRETIDGRYDDLTSGRVSTIDGDEALRQIRAKSDARRAKALAGSRVGLT